MKPPFNEKQFGMGRELEESGEEKRILMNLHVKRMINDHFKPSLKINPKKAKKTKCYGHPCGRGLIFKS
jgi:hypothetical protein